MCFCNEGDWCVARQEEDELTADKPMRCDECGVLIQPGQYVRHIHQWESEWCLECEAGWCDCGEDGCCKCPEPDYGEEFDYHRCEECDKFLDAVESAENEAGCRPHESRPMLASLFEEMNNVNIHEKRRYFKKAIAMFPELKASGYMTRIARAACG